MAAGFFLTRWSAVVANFSAWNLLELVSYGNFGFSRQVIATIEVINSSAFCLFVQSDLEDG